MPKAATPIDLDRRRLLLYRSGDIATMERLLNNESFEEGLSRRGYQRLLTYLWAGLRHEDEKLTVERLGRILDKSAPDYSELWNTVSEAFVNSNILRKPETAPDPTSSLPSGPAEP